MTLRGRPPGWAWGAAVALAFALALFRSGQWDYWFHLAAGRWIVAHGLPAVEPWCLAARGQWPWLGEWLFHVALYGVHAATGEPGVTLWRGLWAAGATALLVTLLRGLRADQWPALLALPLLLALSRARMTARPEQLTLVLALLVVVVLERARRGDRDFSVALVPAQVLWANVHPGWVLGPALVALYALAEALRGREPAARARAKRWALLALLLVAASAATPRPLDTLSLRLVREARQDPLRHDVDELESWTFAGDLAGPYSACVALAIVALLLGGRRAWQTSPALVVAALGGLVAGLLAYRLRALGATLAFPAIALAFAPRGAGATPGGNRPRARPSAGQRAPLVLAAVAGAVGLATIVVDAPYFPLGFSPPEIAVPVRAVQVADSLGLAGPTLNTQWYGGYLLWARGENHLPLLDTRNRGGAAFLEGYALADRDEKALASLLDVWRITHAILEPPRSIDSRMAPMLAERPDWALVFADDAGLLFVRRDQLDSAGAARAYRQFTPDYTVMADRCVRALGDSVLARALNSELERARAESRWHGRASLWLGTLALARHHYEAAVRLLDEAYALAPLLPGLALRQGYAHRMIGDVRGARAALRRALREPNDADNARRLLDAIG